jgi:hypothetical protein
MPFGTHEAFLPAKGRDKKLVEVLVEVSVGNLETLVSKWATLAHGPLWPITGPLRDWKSLSVDTSCRRGFILNHFKRWFGMGQLGPVCQNALITAFGPTGRLLHRLGFQWTSIRPLLLALTNSSAVIGGDQRFLMTERSQEREAIHSDIDRTIPGIYSG